MGIVLGSSSGCMNWESFTVNDPLVKILQSNLILVKHLMGLCRTQAYPDQLCAHDVRARGTLSLIPLWV